MLHFPIKSYVDFVARSWYLRQGQVITSHSELRDVITHPCLRYLLLAIKSSYFYSQILTNVLPEAWGGRAASKCAITRWAAIHAAVKKVLHLKQMAPALHVSYL